MQSPIAIANAVVLLLFSVWLIMARFKIRQDSIWPFVYYALLVVFHQAMQGLLAPLPIYIAVVCALFLRFEFMSKAFRWVFRLAEAGGLTYVITALLGYVGF